MAVAPIALAVVAVTTASTVLIAPGVSVANVPVGGLTTSAAQRAIEDKVADTTIEVRTPQGTATLSGSDLGATINSHELAASAKTEFPLWNVGAWNTGDIDARVEIDEDIAHEAIQSALPDAFVAPTDAEVTFDGTSYVASTATPGASIVLEDVRKALEDAVAAGSGTLDAEFAPFDARITTAEAQAAADWLNEVLAGAGFYVGEENAVPVSAATVASWVSFTLEDDGTVKLMADANKIAELVPTLAKKIDRAPVNGTQVVDRAGTVLEEGTTGVSGRTLGDTSKVAAEFASQLESGNGKFALSVKEVAPEFSQIEKWIEVDLTNQMMYAYENGEAVLATTVSTGVSGWDTTPGTWRVRAHIYQQDMGCVDGYDYCTKDVPWVLYFNGDEAFHGTYWHNEFGTPMSHGCVNMRISEAEWLFFWTPVGTEVDVYY